MGSDQLSTFVCRFDECVDGGDSILLDGFAVVEEMRKVYPKQFDTLTRVPTTFQKIRYERFRQLSITHDLSILQAFVQ